MLRCPRVNRSHWLVTLTSHFLREKELKTDSRLAVHRMYSSLHVRTQQQGTILEADSNPHQTPIAGSLILDFSAFRSAGVQSQLTATSASQVQAIRLPQPPKQLGLQAPTAMSSSRRRERQINRISLCGTGQSAVVQSSVAAALTSHLSLLSSLDYRLGC
ncbi:uncharacterized protein [Macaca nemestrina]|uniref:uncharacterized protein isoform X2 n=1 Tax=Macaca nemestrina TaxID=9545 RepID=UPI0039B8845F